GHAVKARALEVDLAVTALVAAAAIESRDTAAVVASAGAALALGLALQGLNLVELAVVDEARVAQRRRAGLETLDRHFVLTFSSRFIAPVRAWSLWPGRVCAPGLHQVISMLSPFSRVTSAFFQSDSLK